MSTDADRDVHRTDQASAPTSRHKRNPVIVAAFITGLLGLLGAVTAAIINAAGKSETASSPPSASPTSTTTVTTAPEPEGSSHYAAAFRGSTAEGEVTWSTAEPPRVKGILKLQGSLARSACSVRVSFEVRGTTGTDTLAGGENKCSNTSGWPTFTWSVPSKHAAEAARIDILVRVENEVLTRISCTRSGGCETS